MYTDLDPGEVFPDAYNAADLLAGGEQPTGLLRALLRRRFRYAVSYASALGPVELARLDRYASGYGAYEDNYFWKLDRVIAVGYAPVRGLPAGILARRPGPDRASALGGCFGPFELARASWTIRHGGGFWCRRAADTVALIDSPSPASELITTSAWTAAGTIRVTGRVGAQLLLARGGGRAVLAGRTATGWVVESRGARGTPTVQRTSVSVLALDLGGGAGLRIGPDPIAARISMLATQGVRVDLSGLRLRT